MPQRNRAGGDETAEVLYRCGSQQGRVATHLPLDSSESDLEAATVAFVVAQLAEYRALRRSKQKNPTRNLKKYFDRDDIRVIEDAIASGDGDGDDGSLAGGLV
ncbi:MAG TPA: hypothetical protein VGM94_08010 [Galbitalea sp.]